tara:strand:+ start:229 stop:594 length:366 start_codon:yes stop_codon:yes gene_type:complete
MPTKRKRIGYLPSIEIQEIINKICVKEKLSQSKVTGLLVEEAITARKLNKNNLNKDILEYSLDKLDNYSSSKDIYGNRSNQYIDTNIKIKDDEENDYKILKEFIKYQKFKKLLIRALSDEE